MGRGHWHFAEDNRFIISAPCTYVSEDTALLHLGHFSTRALRHEAVIAALGQIHCTCTRRSVVPGWPCMCSA